jgi:hypothetical protein
MLVLTIDINYCSDVIVAISACNSLLLCSLSHIINNKVGYNVHSLPAALVFF